MRREEGIGDWEGREADGEKGVYLLLTRNAFRLARKYICHPLAGTNISSTVVVIAQQQSYGRKKGMTFGRDISCF
jgi:hypothetical protein